MEGRETGLWRILDVFSLFRYEEVLFSRMLRSERSVGMLTDRFCDEGTRLRSVREGIRLFSPLILIVRSFVRA